MLSEFIRRNVFWIFVSLISLLVWILRWIPESFVRFYNIVFISWDYYPRVLVRGSMYTVATVGMVARLIAVILGLISVYLIWKKKFGFLSIRKMVAVSVGLEGVYFASLIPSILYLFALGWTWNSVLYSLFGVGYFFHVILTFPFLVILAIKLYTNKSGLDQLFSLNFVAFVFVGYIVALWANVVFHWFGIALTEGLTFLFAEETGILAWNGLILMTLGVVFAFLGGFYFLRKNKESLKWMSFSLIMVGLHYLVYLIYHVYIDSLISVWLLDVWTVALLGLGLSILKSKSNPITVKE